MMGTCEFGKMVCFSFMNYYYNLYMKFKKYYTDEFSETKGIYIQSQHMGLNMQLLMEGIDIYFFLIIIIK